MKYSDVPVVMECGNATLLGIVSQPETPLEVGLVILVGGEQYRVGSHRQFVLLARRLAKAGYPVLRFDFTGMGDSDGDFRGFESTEEDISVALNALQRVSPGVKRIALWGLCDGASAVLLYSGQSADPRLAGLCLLNPWVRTEATFARTRVKHYYGQRLLQREFWKKLVTGRFGLRRALLGLWQNVMASRRTPRKADANMPFQRKMAFALRHFPGKVLLVLSGNDYTAKEFVECTETDPDWAGLLRQPGLRRLDIAEADHTFSSAQWRTQVEDAVLDWMVELQ